MRSGIMTFIARAVPVAVMQPLLFARGMFELQSQRLKFL